MIAIRQRFAYIQQGRSRPSTCGRSSRRSNPGSRAALSRRWTPSTSSGAARPSGCCEAVLQANEPTVLEEESFRALMDLPARRFPTFDAEEQSPGGGLGPGALPERGRDRGPVHPQGEPLRRGAAEIESHVPHTFEFLRRSPGRASSAHSRDRLRPPREAGRVGLPPQASRPPDIPVQSRMMTISDIYDALVAPGPALQEGGPGERALDILKRRGAGRQARQGPPARVHRGQDLRAAGLHGAAASRGPEPRCPSPPLVIAHRGDSAHRPENTLASFASALEVGAALVELDVQLTRDGHVVVIHDPTSTAPPPAAATCAG